MGQEMTDNQQNCRSIPFGSRENNRYWWFRVTGSKYVPPVFDFLNDEEWSVMNEWYDDTEKKFSSPGECAIPPITMLFALIMGNRISRIVQLGHYVGFSTLLMGFMLRRMQCPNGLFSIDLDPHSTQYTSEFVKKAKLTNHIKLIVRDSAAQENPEEAISYLGGKPQLIFIDSSHQYQHTLNELELWFKELSPGGFILMHDVSKFAASFDPTSKGSVYKAANEWLSDKKGLGAILINSDNINTPVNELVYIDGRGLGIIQKPLI